MPTTLPSTVHELVERYTAAEAAQDAATLADLATEDLRLVGPLGFVLDREAWLRRFADGLSYAELAIDDVDVREHGDQAVAIATQTQSASYQGHTMAGRFRVTFVAGREDAGWRLRSAHLSGPLPGTAP
ncbi:nuclear transport factor 2 family protein [Actinomycetospora rhizophila]|uniref:Nuclear transport factor 2 family protein n=1 Tax=Actinomycetospora rhizophila TaxID=1416876 RepID=A0ABV9ZT50_9PSEU